jgi:hypothetical protein
MDPTQIIAATAAEMTKDVVPEVYKDGLQPAVKELGKSLHTVSKVVNIALSPISAMVWGYDKIAKYIETSISNKVPEENIQTPDPSIAVPAVEALRYSAHNEDLREMFSNLLATAMDISTSSKAHPAFVEVIKQINSDEAKIIKSLIKNDSIPIIRVRMFDLNTSIESFAEPLTNFSHIPYEVNCSNPELGPSYLVNLERLGLVNLSYDLYSIHPNAYDFVENHPIVNDWRDNAPRLSKRFEIQRGGLTITPFGKKFIESCVISK